MTADALDAGLRVVGSLALAFLIRFWLNLSPPVWILFADLFVDPLHDWQQATPELAPRLIWFRWIAVDGAVDVVATAGAASLGFT